MGNIGDFFKSVLGICETEELNSDLWRLDGADARITLGQAPQLQQPDGAVYLKGKGLKYPVLVVKAEGERYLAFANRCTHIGHRKLDPVPGKSTLRCCSVNHSTYDYEGKRTSGPAKGDLETYEVELENGELVVKL
jgi:cytochrome b6-f complex iron-sulfur subunit